jgi:hypothetical protein
MKWLFFPKEIGEERECVSNQALYAMELGDLLGESTPQGLTGR